ncbi:hypothetical protein J1N35_026108 [Gossypium stocksii]|uniref:Zinc finger GRF-type domain-containing protein n=1 Tax=Gossypium stocksii TaxID=47602 RepID=A0A9D3V810_9ROSI|nr:hypothetical protein J1N35_026108 [Gossypium stocksii]
MADDGLLGVINRPTSRLAPIYGLGSRRRRRKRRIEKIKMSAVIPVYYCGNPAKLNTSWSNDNPGRRFFECKKFGSEF